MAFGKKPKAPEGANAKRSKSAPLTWGCVLLRGKDGSIRAVAMVDSDDMEEVGKHRWWLNGHGYAVRKARLPDNTRVNVVMHRQLLGLNRGDLRQGDHINGNRLDNRRSNLRIVTRAQNAQNRTSTHGKSKYRGVAWKKRERKWSAAYTYQGKRYYCGFFDDEEHAARAVSEQRALHMPFSQDALLLGSENGI